MGVLSRTLCDDQLNWLEKYLSKSKKNVKNLRRSWHRVDGNLSQESNDIIKELRNYEIPVISFNDKTTYPYIEIRVHGPGEYSLEFDGQSQITKYFSILKKVLAPSSN